MDKKNKTGKEEEEGIKRSIDDYCDEYAKRKRVRQETRAEEGKNPGQGMDIEDTEVARETGGVHMRESESKFSEEACEFINGAWRA